MPIKTLRYYGSVAGYFIRMAIKRQLEYPSYLVCWIIGNPLQYLVGVWMIGVITERFQSLNGWSYKEITFLYGLSLLSHGLMIVFFIQTWNIENMVRRGEFDRILLRPINAFFHFCFQYFNFIGFFDLLPGVIIFIYGCKATGFIWSISNIVKLLLVLTGAVLIRAAFFTATGSVAFWTKSSRYFVLTGLAILEKTTMYPLTIYPYLIQVIFTFIIPFGFISFYPASEFMNIGNKLEIPAGFALLTPAVGLASTIAIAIFNRGLKRYESAGS